MPTMLGEPYSVLWRGRYPHMLPEDIPVWNMALDRDAHLFERVFYDVRLGGVVDSDPAHSEKMREMYYNVTAKRIDVLAELKDELWIIEVATKPGLRAVGQLMTYVALWYDDPKINKKAVGVLVAHAIDADLARSLEIYGMRPRLFDVS